MVYGKDDNSAYIGYTNLLDFIVNNPMPQYSFEHSIYINAHTKIIVVCEKHGKFKVRPNDFKNGTRCPTCGIARRGGRGDRVTKTTSDYKEQLHKVSPTILVLGKYSGDNVKITHKHLTCGYAWEGAPNNHLSGTGCPKCSTSGFNRSKPAILYYLSIKKGEAYKIGITNRSVKQRYTNEELLDIDVIEEWEFEKGQEAYDMEQEILKRYKHLKYKGKDLLKSGNTEMFLFDVLGLTTPKEVG